MVRLSSRHPCLLLAARTRCHWHRVGARASTSRARQFH